MPVTRPQCTVLRYFHGTTPDQALFYSCSAPAPMTWPGTTAHAALEAGYKQVLQTLTSASWPLAVCSSWLNLWNIRGARPARTTFPARFRKTSASSESPNCCDPFSNVHLHTRQQKAQPLLTRQRASTGSRHSSGGGGSDRGGGGATHSSLPCRLTVLQSDSTNMAGSWDSSTCVAACVQFGHAA